MAISTDNIITSLSDIPSDWAFEYLLNLPDKLSGGDIKISSPFSIDKTPSFSIYKNGDYGYKFKCFSTGIKGNVLDLIIELQRIKGNTLTKPQALSYLKKEFVSFTATGEYVPQDTKVILNGKGRVTEWLMRTWNDDDTLYWNRYDITPRLLEEYNIAPIQKFVMEKLKNGKLELYDFDHPRIYGFFRNDGSLYKIYRPGSKKGKYIKVGADYIQGSDQIITPKENLMYIKSLKDIVGFKVLDIDGWDLKAPDSENVLIPKKQIEADKKTYKKILTWMDPDQCGTLATKQYKELYDLPPIDFDMGTKDCTDSIERWGAFPVKLKVIQAL